MQKGKCINCDIKISVIYPLHEILHLIVSLSVYFIFGISVFSLLIYILFSIFYILFICDLQRLYIPFYLNILISVIGLSVSYIGDIFYINTINILTISQFELSLYGFICGYSILWFINSIFRLVRNVDGIGGGDFLLLGGMGSLIGPFGLAPIIFLGSLVK